LIRWQTVIALMLVGVSCTASAQNASLVPAELREQAVNLLRNTLDSESEWVKVHAAEYLLALQYTQGVREAFSSELAEHGEQPQYRIGIWRVLAKATPRNAEREKWIDSIRAVYTNPDAPDRLHAAETLAKLNYAADEREAALFKTDAELDNGPLAAFACCVLVHSGHTEYERVLVELLSNEDQRTRLCAAYALRHIDEVTEETATALLERARVEPEDSGARAYLLGAAYLHNPGAEPAVRFKQALLEYVDTGSAAERTEAISILANRGVASDLPQLERILDDPEADVRAAAAWALLRIGRRSPHYLGGLDWLAIGLYASVMLGVGWYYARRTATSEDYLLGGRKMNPFTVGLSMFATLLSTLTYLALPGEMMKHGPMIVSQYLAWPLIFLVIGFVLIPAILRQRVTSAYEILELRLGKSVRLLGSVFFLSLRLMWMALIIYATSSKVLVPILQLDQSMTPFICIAMGVVTIAYTTMGGLRAVVVTDVMQTAILFGGAILTLTLITMKMGGVSEWWPTVWAPNWDPMRIAYDPTARVTVAGAMTSAFVWYTCTAGSDQVAVQRYLATKDARAARRMIATSLTTDASVGVFLAILGLALWSFFQANPYLFPDGYQSLQNADTLFPRFIALGLPTGISGLVIAGLLAAAMSSLSSGVNASSLVITVDFLKRRADDHIASHEKKNIRAARGVSVLIGAVVIALSIAAGLVGGNLLEVVYKVVNLLTAPLFVLFFMALFVPWATAPGAIAAGIASAAMAIAIAYGGLFGLSFIWIMPMALITGVIVGPTVSAFTPRKRTA
jgi:solute:Na+ symporter, SSS family